MKKRESRECKTREGCEIENNVEKEKKSITTPVRVSISVVFTQNKLLSLLYVTQNLQYQYIISSINPRFPSKDKLH